MGEGFEKKLTPDTATKSEQPRLADLLGYQNPNYRFGDGGYVDMIYKTRLDLIDSGLMDYSKVFFELISEKEKPLVESLLREKLKERPLVDLGSGSNLAILRRLAEIGVQAEYIGVDLDFNDLRQRNKRDAVLDPKSKPEIDITDLLGVKRQEGSMAIATLVQADMLHFISQLQSRSVNITVNGINDSLPGSQTARDSGYFRALAQEIERVVPAGGLVFGCGATPIFSYLNQELFKIHYEKSDIRDTAVYVSERNDKKEEKVTSENEA